MSEFVLAKVEIEETAATIAAEKRHVAAAIEAIKDARMNIERVIRKDRFFLTTLEPCDPPEGCAPIIKRMCEASNKAGVGPMAAVAGAIAQVAMEAMASDGCKHGWVDNGGDVALLLNEPITMEIFCEPGSDTAAAFELEATDGIVGICSSSGRLGHSISFGNADVALAVCEDAILADALATAIGNRVNDGGSLGSCFDPFKGIAGFDGGLAMVDGRTAIFGRVPRLIEVEHSAERLTAHSRMSSSKFTGQRPKAEVRT